VEVAAKAVRAAAERASPQRAAKPASAPDDGGAESAQATRLAAEIERALASGRRDVLSNEALQALMASAGNSETSGDEPWTSSLNAADAYLSTS
jgi:hypothetical protein